MKFKVVITYDAEYSGYVIDVPELVGCMSQGKTIDDALVNIRDAIKGKGSMADQILLSLKKYF